MAELKTQKTRASVDAFLDGIADTRRRADAKRVSALMQEITGEPPAMWGPAIVGFGHRVVRYANGSTADWMLIGFSPRKAELSLYVLTGFDDAAALLQTLGKHRAGTGCLYVKWLDDVDEGVLRTLIARSVAYLRQAQPAG